MIDQGARDGDRARGQGPRHNARHLHQHQAARGARGHSLPHWRRALTARHELP